MLDMTRRLAKEYRSLLLPWCVAAVAACLMPLLAMLAEHPRAGAAPFFFALSNFALFGGIVVTAGMSFGAEFQQRTLGLLVSQPVERWRLWNEKMLALSSAVAAVGLLYWLGQEFVEDLPAEKVV